MEKITYSCDVCHKEMQRTSPPYETLVKRISTQYPDPNGRYLEIAVVVRAWSGQMDICRNCAERVFASNARRLVE